MSDANRQTPLDARIARLAYRQHGVISLAQLIELGLGASAARDRVRAGRLHRIHRGVYAVGHRVLKAEGRWMAATLACGEGAALSHHDAGEVSNILRRSARAKIHVTSPRRTGREARGIAVHSGATLRPDDVTTVDRIPCTSVPRTLLDLAEVLDRRALQRAVERAEALRAFDLTAAQQLLVRSAGRRGARALQQAIATHVPTITRSELEDLFLAVCERAGLPRPVVNHRIEDMEVDFLWPDHGLVVETDGYETHRTREAFVRDRRKSRRLRNLGWRVERFTWWEVSDGPDAVAAELSALLAAPARRR